MSHKVIEQQKNMRSEFIRHRKNQKRKRFLYILLFLCILFIGVIINRTHIIITFGIPIYRFIKYVLMCCIGVCIITIGTTITWEIRPKKNAEPTKQETDTEGVLTEKTLRNRINKLRQGKYPEIYLQWCEDKIDQMNQNQEQLSQLLRENNLKGLQNIEDAMQGLEDALYGEIQIFLNYLSILNADKDVAKMEEKLKETEENTNTCMQMAKDLLIAIVDYTNGREKNQTALVSVQTCIDAIYDSIKLLR